MKLLTLSINFYPQPRAEGEPWVRFCGMSFRGPGIHQKAVIFGNLFLLMVGYQRRRKVGKLKDDGELVDVK